MLYKNFQRIDSVKGYPFLLIMIKFLYIIQYNIYIYIFLPLCILILFAGNRMLRPEIPVGLVRGWPDEPAGDGP